MKRKSGVPSTPSTTSEAIGHSTATVGQVKPNKRVRKFVSSYDVFMRHVNLCENGVDVSGLFTKKCFEEWLSTRPGRDIKHPEQSYQRVLYAHIRGADNRKPFPPHAEAALLKLLRSGREKNPWKALFDNHKFDVGRRGFRSLGFHEKNSGSNMPSRRPLPAATISPMGSDGALCNQMQFPHSSTFLQPWPMNTPFRSTPPITPWEKVCHTFDRFVPFQASMRSLQAAQTRGLNLLDPSVYSFLNNPNNVKKNPMFDWKFLHPAPEQRTFDESSPIGMIVYGVDLVIKAENEAAISILGASQIHKHFFQLLSSFALTMYTTIGHIPNLYQEGKAWKRDFFVTSSGTPLLCLIEMVLKDSDTIIRFQDQSQLFPDICQRANLRLLKKE